MNDWKINDVFYFHLDDEECLRRILSRTQIEKRPDESLEAVSKRLELYHEHTEPLLKTYHEMGILKKIDGSKSIAEIHADVRKLLPSISS